MTRKSLKKVVVGPVTLICLIGLSLLVNPRSAAAHERWFVNDPNSYQLDLTLLWSWPVLIIIGLALALTGLAIVVDRQYRRWHRARNPRLENGLIGLDEKRLRRVYAYLPLLLALHTAVPLLINGFGLQLFAPNLHMAQNLLSGLFALAEILIALALVYGVFTQYAALALIGLFVGGLVLSPFLAVPTILLPEHIYLVAIGAFFYIIGRGPFSADALLGRRSRPDVRLVEYAIPVLRTGVGLSIVILAFTEKLLNPVLAQAFLTQKINFNLGSGFGISNDIFIYLAGFGELVFGLLLISGALPRLVIIGLWIPFNLTLPYLGWLELAGHLPTYAVMLILLIVGPSSRRAARNSARLLAQEAGVLEEPTETPSELSGVS